MPWIVKRQLPNNGPIETGPLSGAMTPAQYKAQVEPAGYKVLSWVWQDGGSPGGSASTLTGMSPAGWLLLGVAGLWWLSRR